MTVSGDGKPALHFILDLCGGFGQNHNGKGCGRNDPSGWAVVDADGKPTTSDTVKGALVSAGGYKGWKTLA
jgi:LDH2 family malate/lactate/ureidoglycolate dehydrogenase